MRKNIIVSSLLLTFVSVLSSGCSTPVSGPDKTAGGAVVGGAWGTGAGAVVGNQVATAGLGAGVGAGFGAVAGMLIGGSLDQLESGMLEQQQILNDLSARTRINFEKLRALQDEVDNKIASSAPSAVYQVYFGPDSTQLKAGAIANLQAIAESMKNSTSYTKVFVNGHTDDSGNKEHNKNLAESRAKEVVSYLAGRGISMDQIKMNSYAAERPLATNSTPEGRQLNRRVDVFLGN
jgi:outer membrane protein OmpA-like peptidoglycan-associated protein